MVILPKWCLAAEKRFFPGSEIDLVVCRLVTIVRVTRSTWRAASTTSDGRATGASLAWIGRRSSPSCWSPLTTTTRTRRTIPTASASSGTRASRNQHRSTSSIASRQCCRAASRASTPTWSWAGPTRAKSFCGTTVAPSGRRCSAARCRLQRIRIPCTAWAWWARRIRTVWYRYRRMARCAHGAWICWPNRRRRSIFNSGRVARWLPPAWPSLSPSLTSIIWLSVVKRAPSIPVRPLAHLQRLFIGISWMIRISTHFSVSMAPFVPPWHSFFVLQDIEFSIGVMVLRPTG